MKKKGFTLVELLAVIVVLAIITLIATPIILNVIKSAKEKAFINSAYGVLEATEYYYARKNLGLAYKEKNNITELVYKDDIEVTTLENNEETENLMKLSNNNKEEEMKISFPDKKDVLKLKGKEPDGGTVFIKSKGGIALSLWNDDIKRCAIKSYESSEITLASPELTKEECTEGSSVETETQSGMMWDGWITLTLYYPENSIDQKWRLGEAGDVREEDWKIYDGSITIPLKDIENVWIKYKLNGKVVVVPPRGTLWVDIEPSSYTIKEGQTVTAKINSEAGAEVYYKTGNEWIKYNDSTNIQLTTSGLIEAKAIKTEDVYNSDGTKAYSQKVTVYDSVYIRNYNTEVGTSGTVSDNTGETSSGNTIIRDSETGKIIPSYYIAGPTITVSPTERTTSVDVSLSAPNARKIYIKVGNESYKEYTGSIEINKNTAIYAYYITNNGEYSSTSYRKITNIYSLGNSCNKPYLNIKTTPSLNKKYVEEMKVKLEYDEGDEVEYSLNGVEYEKYTKEITINENKRIYARSKNDCGITEEYIDITNIGKKGEVIPPVRKTNLKVDISTTPDSSVTTKLVETVKVSIEYDSKATKKYYSIGKYGEIKEYKEPFTVEENETIYAYALSETGYGQTYKIINNIGNEETGEVKGISSPVIKANPNNSVQTDKVNITIEYDKNAKTKKYRIGNGSLREYNGTFTVEENTTVYAVNSDSSGNTKDVTYKIENIVEKTPVYMINYGDYFIIKLNYPEVSKEETREYKYGTNGIWKKYKSDGILLVVNNSINTDGIIKIKDENGVEKVFNGTVEYVTGATSEIMNNLYMRWDTKKPDTPTITINPIDPTKEVNVTINYDKTCKIKEYKLVEPNKIESEYKTYKESFKVNKKGTVIYAKCMNQSELYSDEAIKQITNIDEDSPVIKLSADLETKTQSLKIKVSVTDDVLVDTVMYDKGLYGKSHFKTSGKLISNNSLVTITENGEYTFYAKDGVGNDSVYTIKVGNIDTEAPSIIITESPADKVGLESTISIEYGDAVTKKYKIGKETTTWTNYTEEISLTAYTVLANNQQNSDGSYTICAQGTDDVGNKEEVCRNIFNLDLDAPSIPVINSSAGYPVLTEYGIEFNGRTTIKYDDRNDIDNYYSLDGETWIKYTGKFEVTSGTIYAKSVKKGTGLTMSTTMTISMPSDSLNLTEVATDGNDSTYMTINTYPNAKKYNLYIDSSVYGQELYLKLSNTYYSGNGKGIYFRFYDSSNTIIGDQIFLTNAGTTYNNKIIVPNGAIRLEISYGTYQGPLNIYELRMFTDPVINSTRIHQKITDSGIEDLKDEITIDYFTSSIQRLYKIDDGEWLEYQDKKIKLKLGQTIYAKGISKNGKETVISSYTSVLPSGTILLNSLASDNDPSTAMTISAYPNARTINISIDPKDIGRKLYVKVKSVYASGNGKGNYFRFYDSNNTLLENQIYIPNNYSGYSYDNYVVIPDNASLLKISYGTYQGAFYVYEVKIKD